MLKSKVFRKAAVLFILMMGGTFCTKAQELEEKNEIEQSINNFFLGMKTGDTSLINKQLFNQFELKTIGKTKEGKAEIRITAANTFLNMIANKPSLQVFDERISSFQIMIDQNMAVAWTPYRFYLNDTFSHCGVNVFSLIKDENQWKIFAIMDTRQRENCTEF